MFLTVFLPIIVGAIVNILIYFFERWWSAHHPIRPTEEIKRQFVDHVGKPKFFYLGSNRQKYASKLYDKFVANFDKYPPAVSDKLFTDDDAKDLAKRCAIGLSLSKEEAQ